MSLMRKSPASPLLFLSILGALLYANTLGVPFVLDDFRGIVDNPLVHEVARLGLPFMQWQGDNLAFLPRYFGYLTFALNYQLDGLNLTGYHLVNLLIHLANTILVYHICLRLIAGTRKQDSSNWLPAIAAALFLCHPVQTQAVTYIVQRFTTLAAFFSLATLWYYLTWRDSGHRRHYLLALSAAICAFWTKENTLTLPVLLLLADLLLTRHPDRLSLAHLKPLLPFLLASLSLPLALLTNQQQSAASLSDALQTFNAAANSEITPWRYGLTEFGVVLHYLRLFIWPFGQNLDYDWPLADSLASPQVFLPAVVVVGGIVLWCRALHLAGKTPPAHPLRLIVFGCGWYMVALLIESSVFPISDPIFEHRFYLPSFGVVIVAGAAFESCRQRWSRPATTLIVATICFLSLLTWQRNELWRSPLALWEDTVQKSPQKARPHVNLGTAYAAANRPQDAMREFQTAIALDPSYYGSYLNRGAILSKLGRKDEAIADYRRALQLKPDYAMGYYNLGELYLKDGNDSEALLNFTESKRLNPTYAQVYNALAIMAQHRGDLTGASSNYLEAIRLRPDFIQALNNLGKLRLEQKNFREALPLFQRVEQLAPDYLGVFLDLSRTYSGLGDSAAARAALEQALQLNPEFTAARTALTELGR